ncbi:MAG: ATP synthase F0 subunit B [Oscillospiraceae bacterium]|nr:ATP synthase F0 subunit B [Oscillospiraceae bacterium]
MSNLPLNIDIQQIFLHLFNFTILLAALYFLLYGPVKNFMNKRSAYYEDLDRQAQDKLDEAIRVRDSYDRKMLAAEDEIKRRSEAVHDAAAQQAQAQLKDAKEEAARIVAKARAEAQAEQERILDTARSELSEMVAAATERLLAADTSSSYDQFLDDAVGDEAND